MKSKSTAGAAPYIVWAVIFTLVPMGLVVYFSLTDRSGAFTFASIAAIRDYLPTFGRSIGLGLLSTAICLLLGYPIAYIISRKSGLTQQTMVMLIMLPQWMNFLLRTYAWMSLLENNGFINQFLRLLGLPPATMINTPGAVVLGMVYNFLPFMILPIFSVMEKLDVRITEAAQDLGADGWAVLRRVILPLSLPGIFTGITMVFVPAVSTFVISQLLGGNKNMLIGDSIEMLFVGNATNYNIGSALSLVLMLLMLLSMTVMNKFDNSDEMGGLMV